MSSITRKQFLSGAAGMAGIAALGATSAALADEAAATSTVEYPFGMTAEDYAESAAELEPITDFADEKTYDIVVVGAGTSGVPAVLTALEEGCTVGCLEKNAFAVSQGNGCTGVVLPHCSENGARRFMYKWMEVNSFRADYDLLEFYTMHSGESILWTYKHAMEVDYLPATTGITRYDYEDGQYAVVLRTSYGTKPEDMMNLIQRLAEQAAEQGAEFFYSTPGVQLVVDDDGAVTGVVGKDADGNYIKFNANIAVIMATGDYQNNSALMERWMPDVAHFEKKQFSKTGDGILMAMAAGCNIVPVGHQRQMHDFDSCPQSFTSAPFLYVDENANRFMCEEVPHTSQCELVRNLEGAPGKFSFIMDDDFDVIAAEWGITIDKDTMRNYFPGLEEYAPGIRGNLADVHTADTLEELAESLDIPADQLVATVERYNELCDSGVDADFGKQAMYMRKIEKAPFWAVKRWIRLTSTGGGSKVNGTYQCIREDGSVIPGLYSVGFGAGALSGDVDWSTYVGGMSLGSCVNSGRYATIHAITGGLEPTTPVTLDDMPAELTDLFA